MDRHGWRRISLRIIVGTPRRQSASLSARSATLNTTSVDVNRLNSRLRGTSLLRSQVYEITFEGRADSVIRAEFDDCEVSVGQDTTTLRVGLPVPVALWRIIERMMGLGLKLVELRLVAVPSATSEDENAGQRSPAR
jgi:hypothetical protein